MYEEILTKILGIFDIPSGPIVGMWSLMMLAGCAYSIWTTKQVSTPVAMIFSAVLTNFAAHKIAKVMNGSPAPTPDANDTPNSNGKNLDVQGDGK